MPTPSDLVHQTSTGTGTGNLTLVAVNGKRSFNTAFGTGGTNVFDYFVSNRDAAEWERGAGHLSDATTLVRDTVLASSNAGSAVNFSAGTKDITNDIPASEQNITGLTEDTSPDGEADFIPTYDTSATGRKKILLHRATRFKVGSFTRDVSTASGNQSVTGVGFKPKAVIFMGTNISGANNTMGGWGYGDGTTLGGIETNLGGFFSGNAAAGDNISNYSVITAIASFDSDGFTVSWTKVGSPTSSTGTIYYLALR